MRIAPAVASDAADWVAMRTALWPDGGNGAHAADIARVLADPGDTLNLVARSDGNKALGFLEASLRHDYVEGCKTSPVAFLEGIFVWPEARGTGVAGAMVAHAEDWGRQRGCTEFASDAALDNLASHSMHTALGFAETRRVVYFKKAL
ncbi:aminoglycoside 6'-N-acetyltransferase [Devosia sediminis]|nr:aminoglycoside 6'-N-acetyltransferase [Devosia sediminis]